jgi:YVTN family beta-propeller protein
MFAFFMFSRCSNTESTQPNKNENNFSYVPVSAGNLSNILADTSKDIIYVSDNVQNKVYVVDANSNQIISSISVGGQPTMMDINYDMSNLYVAQSGGSSIAVINTQDYSLKRNILLPYSNPTNIAVCKNKLFVSYNQQFVISQFIIQADSAISSDSTSGMLLGKSYNGDFIYSRGNSTGSDLISFKVTDSVLFQTNFIYKPYGFNGVVLNAPDTALSFIYGFGYANYDGNLPVLNSNDLSSLSILNVDWNVIAVGVSLKKHASIFVAHDSTVTNSTHNRHDYKTADVHVFSQTTLAPIGIITLPDFVKPNGICVAKNGKAFLLIGKHNADAIIYAQISQ